MKTKEFYKQACLGKVQVSEEECLEYLWIVQKECRVCEKELSEHDFQIGHTYWGAFWVPFHASCDMKGYSKNEAYQCQKVDADCNDCFFFDRGEFIAKGIWAGRCKKFGRETKAYPGFCSNHECFEHRLDVKESAI